MFYILFICVCAHVCGWPWKPEEGIGSYGGEYEYVGPHTISENCHMDGWWTYWPTCQACSYWWVMSMSSMSVYGHVFPHVMYQLGHMGDVYGHVDPEAISEINPVGVVWTCWTIRHFWVLSYGWVYVCLAYTAFVSPVTWGQVLAFWHTSHFWHLSDEGVHVHVPHEISEPGDMGGGCLGTSDYMPFLNLVTWGRVISATSPMGVIQACWLTSYFWDLTYGWVYGHFC